MWECAGVGSFTPVQAPQQRRSPLLAGAAESYRAASQRTCYARSAAVEVTTGRQVLCTVSDGVSALCSCMCVLDMCSSLHGAGYKQVACLQDTSHS